jgi:NAD(P)-dependent dehydrogenase (short-subunit alcohol dehydrogenase family)
MTRRTAPVALVTGGLQRLGAAIAARLADEGFALALHARTEGPLSPELAAAIARNGTEHRLFLADFSIGSDIAGLIDTVVEQMGQAPALLVNSAALISDDDFRTADFASHSLHLSINTIAPVLLAQRLAALATAEAPAVIVNILDQRIRQPHGDQFSYSLTKLALAGATRLLAASVAPHARVVGVAPGLTLAGPEYEPAQLDELAGLMPLRRLPEPADIAEAVVYLYRARTVTGQILYVDGGASMRSFDRDFVFLEPQGR